MRIILAALLLLVSSVASAQNLTANRLQLLPAAPSACPVGRVCVIGTSTTSPYRVGFQDASGNLVTMGDAWRLRQCSGACVGAMNGDLWYDTSTGIAYIKQGGSTLPIGVGSSPVINGTITGTYAFGGMPSLAVNLNANGFKITNLATPTSASDAATKNYVDGAINTATSSLVPQTRTIYTTVPLGGGGDLSANRTISLNYTGDFTIAGGSLALASTVSRAASLHWQLNSGSSISANGYWGPNGDTSATATLVSPMLSPCNGTISQLFVQSNANATGLANITVYRGAGGAAISYTATAITCAMATSAKACSDLVNSYTVTAGDLLLIRITTSSWNPSGGSASLRLACS